MNGAKKTAVALVLAVILVMSNLAVSASNAPKAPKEIRFDFTSNQTLNSDYTLRTGSQSTINSGVTITVPKDTTLSIYGNLTVNGTLVIKGTLTILKPATAGAHLSTGAGNLDNFGTVTNKGTVVINNSNFVNRFGGTLENSGQITITGDTDKMAYLRNSNPRPNSSDKGGKIVNTGTILVKNTKGVGIMVEGKSTFQNDGLITKEKEATISGAITGNPLGSTEKVIPPVILDPPVAEEPKAPQMPATPPKTTAPSAPVAPKAPTAPVDPPQGGSSSGSNIEGKTPAESAKDALNNFSGGVLI